MWAYSTSWLQEIPQIINSIGLYSYNLFVVTIFTIPVFLFYKISKVKKILGMIIVFLIILALHIKGNYEINKNKEFIKTIDKKIFVKVISPNFDLKYGLSTQEIEERLKKLIKYSDPEKNKKTIFVWPEGVFSGYSYKEILPFKKLIINNFSKNHYIILGVSKLDTNSGNFYNSMIVVNNNFEIIQNYNKRKLVPFGEFLPFENFLKGFGLKKITEGYGSFIKGKSDNNLIFEELKILPLICYEIIFTSLIQKSESDTNLIVNISEDGWFGKTIGPEQHFAKSIFRAIENNTFLIRSANKGISAIIDNKGNIIKSMSRNEAGNIDFKVPLIKSNKIKNDLIFFVLLITYLVIFLIYKFKNAK